MSHERFLEMLARRPELAPAEQSELESHLAACPECRAAAADYARQAALLRSMPLVQPPATLRGGVLRQIHAPKPIPFRRRPAMALAPLAGVAAIVLAVAAAQLRPVFNAAHRAALAPTPTVAATHPAPSTRDTAVPGAAAKKTRLTVKHHSLHRHAAHPQRSTPATPAPASAPQLASGPVYAPAQPVLQPTASVQAPAPSVPAPLTNPSPSLASRAGGEHAVQQGPHPPTAGGSGVAASTKAAPAPKSAAAPKNSAPPKNAAPKSPPPAAPIAPAVPTPAPAPTTEPGPPTVGAAAIAASPATPPPAVARSVIAPSPPGTPTPTPTAPATGLSSPAPVLPTPTPTP